VVALDYLSSDRFLASLTRYGDQTNLMAAGYFANSGEIDSDFGLSGEVISRQTGPSVGTTGQAVAADGTFYVAGWHGKTFGKKGYVVTRFAENGRAIREFGDRGTAIGKTGQDIALTGVAVQRDGKAVASGGHKITAGRNPAGVIMRFTRNGQPDWSFGKYGVAKFPVKRRGNSSTALMDLAVLPNGKIVAAGYSRGRIVAVKLTKNGDRDRSFGGGDGIVSIPRKSENDCLVNGWCLDASLDAASNGDVVVLANREGLKQQFVTAQVVRFTSNGKLRRSFGKRGVADFGKTVQYGSDVVAKSNGPIVVVGSVGESMGGIQIRSNGSIDASFGNRGRFRVGGPSIADSVTLQRDGSITLAGASPDEVKFARFLP